MGCPLLNYELINNLYNVYGVVSLQRIEEGT